MIESKKDLMKVLVERQNKEAVNNLRLAIEDIEAMEKFLAIYKGKIERAIEEIKSDASGHCSVPWEGIDGRRIDRINQRMERAKVAEKLAEDYDEFINTALKGE